MMFLLLLAAPLDLGTREAGSIRVGLVIAVPGQGAGPGLAAVRLELQATGPATMQLDGPRLEDALAAWVVRRAISSWTAGRVAWSVEVEQTKPGAARLPGVSMRVRESPDTEWHELAWHDPLGETLGVAPPAALPEPARQPPWLLIAAGAALLVRVAFLFLLRKPRPAAPLSPQARAIAGLEALAGTPAERLDSLVAILRRYTEEEPASVPAFAQVLAWSEKVRFSPIPATQENLDQALAMARQAIGEYGLNTKNGEVA